MKTFLDCIPCFIRQSIDAVRSVTDDESLHEQIVRIALAEAGEMDFQLSPPAMAQIIHRRIRELTGIADPYAERKVELNRMALALREELRDMIGQCSDPLEAAVQLAIAGNTMDLGVKSRLDPAQVRSTILNCFADPLEGDIEMFRRDIQQATSILYLTDNAGEIFFDRLLIEQLPLGRTTVAVKGGPIINDATMQDAEAAGLTELVEVIDNGSDAPGTILEDCSEDFRKRFTEADLVLSKGQGNYETLAGCGRSVWYLLRVKCDVIASDVGCPVGTALLRRF